MSKQGSAVIGLLALALALALAGADVAVAQDADAEAQELREEALRESERQQEQAQRERELVQAEAQRERERVQAEAQQERELVQAEAQRQRELDRAETERQRELIAQERELVAQAQRAEREQQQEEVRRARAEMEQARRELEQAARTIATQVQVLPDLENLEGAFGNYQVFLGNFGNQARIGASVVDAEQGALVTQVTPGSGAATAGLQVGDVIQSVNGTAVSTDEHPTLRLREEIGNVEPGETVTLVVERAGRTLDLDVETERGFGAFAGQAPRGEFVFAPGGRGDAPNVISSVPGMPYVMRWGLASSPWADMELTTMSEALGRYFDTSEGLLVLSAPEDDAIDIEDGDVILSISGRTPNSPEHAIRILSSFESGETIEFSIMRDGRRDTVEYTVPEQSNGAWQRFSAPQAVPAPAAPAPPVPTPE